MKLNINKFGFVYHTHRLLTPIYKLIGFCQNKFIVWINIFLIGQSFNVFVYWCHHLK